MGRRTRTPFLPAPSQGRFRRVVRELPASGVQKQGQYRWRYELECGHVVERRSPGRSAAYCSECIA